MADADDIARYVERLMGDEKFQERVTKSASSGKKAVKRAKRKKSAGEALGDARIRRQALAAVAAASEAVEALNRPEKKPKSRWLKRLIGLSLLGFGVYMATNDEARSGLMEAVGLGSDQGPHTSSDQ